MDALAQASSKICCTSVVTLVSNKEEFLGGCRQEDPAMKKVWEGHGPTKCICDLARGAMRATSHTSQEP